MFRWWNPSLATVSPGSRPSPAHRTLLVYRSLFLVCLAVVATMSQVAALDLPPGFEFRHELSRSLRSSYTGIPWREGRSGDRGAPPLASFPTGARAIPKDHAIIFSDTFFAQATLQPRVVAHELTHLADSFRIMADSREWRSLVEPRIARLLRQMGDKGKGLEQLRRAILLSDQRALALAHDEGLPSLQAGLNLDEALAEYLAHQILGDPARTPDEIRRFLQLHLLSRPFTPDPASRFLHQGLAALEEGNLDDAIRSFDQAVLARPDLSISYEFRAGYWKQKNNIDRALLWFDKKEFRKAVDDFTVALALRPADADLYFWRGRSWLEAGSWDNAIADLGESIARLPGDPGAFYYRGQAWAKKGETDRALADFAHALSLDPKYLLPHAARGDLWFSKGQYASAVADYTGAIGLRPDIAALYYWRGRAHHALREFDRAIEDYRTTLRLQPQMKPVVEPYMRLAESKQPPSALLPGRE